MNNLLKELIDSSEKNEVSTVDMVAQAKQLLSSNDAEERRLLSNLGLDAEILFYEQQNSDLQEKIKQKEFFQKPIVTLEEIKALCLKYRLYFRNSNMYVGKIPTYLGAALNRFVKEKNIIVGAHKNYSDFYMIAPPKMFSDYTSPAEAIKQSRNKMKANFHKMMNPDPILLYKLPNGNFAIVESWGNDFTLVRRAKALFHSPSMIDFLVVSIFYIAIPILFYGSLVKWIPDAIGIQFKPETGWGVLYQVTGGVLGVAFAILYCIFFLFNEDFLRDGWDEYKKRIATKHNWDNKLY